MRERNREWARRIKALMPQYDIVVVYAGSGHLDNTYHLDLQPMLKQTDFLDITLYPLEELPKETAAWYEQRATATEQKDITQEEKKSEWQKQGYSNINFDNVIDSSNYVETEWIDPQKPWWIWINTGSEELQKWAEPWDPEKAKLYEAEEKLQEEIYPYTSPFSLKVYLPAN